MTTKKQDKYIQIAKRLQTKKYATIAKAVNRTRQAVHSALTQPEANQKLVSQLTAQEQAQDQAFIEAVRVLQVNTATYRPKELSALVGQPNYPRAQQALIGAGIPHARPRQGGPMSELARFAMTLPNTSELTARQIADLGGFHDYANPGLTLKRNGIPFRQGKFGPPKRQPFNKGNQAWQELTHPYPTQTP